MKYDVKPEPVSIEPYAQAMAKITLRENIRRTADGWTADEYTLDVMRLDDLENRVKRDFSDWLQMAKNKAYQDGRNTWTF